MGLFGRLFGGGRDPEGGDAGDLRAQLEAAGGDERVLRRLGQRHREAFTHGGDLHSEFREAWRAASSQAPATPPSAVHLARWEDFDDASISDLIDAANDTDVPYLLVRSGRRPSGGAGGELEALAQLEGEDDVVMVVIGDDDALIRRAFLAAVELDERTRGSLDVLPDLTEVAEGRGERVTFVPA